MIIDDITLIHYYNHHGDYNHDAFVNMIEWVTGDHQCLDMVRIGWPILDTARSPAIQGWQFVHRSRRFVVEGTHNARWTIADEVVLGNNNGW